MCDAVVVATGGVAGEGVGSAEAVVEGELAIVFSAVWETALMLSSFSVSVSVSLVLSFFLCVSLSVCRCVRVFCVCVIYQR